MKLATKQSMAIVALMGAMVGVGCQEDNEPPTYSVVPSIQLESVRFARATSGHNDSLIIVIAYQDGDGDLGGRPTGNAFTYPPNPHTGEEYWVFDSQNLDPELPPYHCADYHMVDITPQDDSWILDTVRADFNPDYYNFSLTLWVKEDGSYQEYNFLEICNWPLGGVFREVNSEIKQDKHLGDVFSITPYNRQEGQITYRMSGAFSILFKNDSVKATVTIRDEALNRSNTVESDPFFIQ